METKVINGGKTSKTLNEFQEGLIQGKLHIQQNLNKDLKYW